MGKPKITEAMVDAAERYLDNTKVPDDYFKVSSDQQQRYRRDAVRGALIEAALAMEAA